MPHGSLSAVGTMYSLVTTPAVVIRPILLVPNSVNQRAPSGPEQIPAGELPDVGPLNSLIPPPVVIRPIWLTACLVIQSAPCAPVVMPKG